MLFTFVLVGMGLTNVNKATNSMAGSLTVSRVGCRRVFVPISTVQLTKVVCGICCTYAQDAEEILGQAKEIAVELNEVGETSKEIRDAAVAELGNLCPANPNITETAGIDIMGIAGQAESDLTMLANFITDGLAIFYENVALIEGYMKKAKGTTEVINFWDWHTKLLFSGLFILPSFLAIGVGLVMLGLDIKPYQKTLTYVFIPLFVISIIATYVLCCAMLPFSAATADACSGGGIHRGGPDDSVLTIYRNFMGNDTTIVKFLGYYTQQCNEEYDPYGFLDIYRTDLEKAISSTDTAASAISGSQDFLEAQCDKDFSEVLGLVNKMSDNLHVLQEQVDKSLELVKCENINALYVNTIHVTGCTYSVDAMAWIFASTLIISVCGLIMVMLRSACYPVEYLDLSDSWRTKPTQTKSASQDSDEDIENDASDQKQRRGWW